MILTSLRLALHLFSVSRQRCGTTTLCTALSLSLRMWWSRKSVVCTPYILCALLYLASEFWLCHPCFHRQTGTLATSTHGPCRHAVPSRLSNISNSFFSALSCLFLNVSRSPWNSFMSARIFFFSSESSSPSAISFSASSSDISSISLTRLLPSSITAEAVTSAATQWTNIAGTVASGRVAFEHKIDTIVADFSTNVAALETLYQRQADLQVAARKLSSGMDSTLQTFALDITSVPQQVLEQNESRRRVLHQQLKDVKEIVGITVSDRKGYTELCRADPCLFKFTRTIDGKVEEAAFPREAQDQQEAI